MLLGPFRHVAPLLRMVPPKVLIVSALTVTVIFTLLFRRSDPSTQLYMCDRLTAVSPAAVSLLSPPVHNGEGNRCDPLQVVLDSQNRDRWLDWRDTDVLVGVMSTPTLDGYVKRSAIRNTWARFKTAMRWRIVFVVGFSFRVDNLDLLCAEAQEHGDVIVLTGFREQYRDLPLKVLHFFEWSDSMVKANFVVKTDDDSFLVVPRLVALMEQHRHTKRLYWGTGFRFSEPMRDPSSKWWVSEDIYANCESLEKDAHFPMLVGAGYVMSGDLVAYLADRVRKKDYRDFSMEDVTTGYHIRHADPTIILDDRVRNDGDCTEDAFILHYATPGKLVQYYVRYTQSPQHSLCSTGSSELHGRIQQETKFIIDLWRDTSHAFNRTGTLK